MLCETQPEKARFWKTKPACLRRDSNTIFTPGSVCYLLTYTLLSIYLQLWIYSYFFSAWFIKVSGVSFSVEMIIHYWNVRGTTFIYCGTTKCEFWILMFVCLLFVCLFVYCLFLKFVVSDVMHRKKGKKTKIEFTVCYTRQITALIFFAILIFTDISIKIHRIVCIKQA